MEDVAEVSSDKVGTQNWLRSKNYSAFIYHEKQLQFASGYMKDEPEVTEWSFSPSNIIPINLPVKLLLKKSIS